LGAEVAVKRKRKAKVAKRPQFPQVANIGLKMTLEELRAWQRTRSRG
jgi:hypothetical protein